MENKIGENQYAKRESSDSDSEDLDTIHVHIENEESLRSDLEYLTKKMGIDLEELKKERYQLEQQAKQEEIRKRQQKTIKARLLHEQQMEELFLKNYGTRFFITLGGTRLKKVTELDEFKCPVCNEKLPSIKGWAQLLAEQPQAFHALTANPFNVLGGVPAISTDVECKDKHKIPLMIQQLF